MGNYTKQHKWSVLLTFVFTICSFMVRAQSGSSFGNTFVHTNEEMGVFVQHNFLNGGSGILPGIVGTERTNPKGFVSFNTGSSWVAASSAAYTDGYVMTRQPGAFTFPIGDNNKYRPAAVSASSAAAPASAAYFAIDGTSAVTSSLKGGNEPILPTGGPFPTATKAANVGTVDNVEYWDIDGTTPAKITLTWDASTPISAMVGTNLSNLTIVGWDGTQWVAIPSTFDASSLLQNTSASVFTGLPSSLGAGSITTNAALVPGSFTVYTLAGICPNILITPSVTSLSICSGAEVAITYTTTPAGEQVLWTRMPGNMTGIGNITDYPAATGTTPVSYTYTASTAPVVGCPINTTATIVTVNPVPIVTPSFCSQTICSGQTGAITFNSSIPATINWLRVEDGLTGTGDISSLFATAGNFTYKIWGLSASPASCPSSTTITCTILVTPGLTVAATANSATVCVGSPLSLSASAVPAGTYTYNWTGPNGYVSTSANPTVSATATLTQSGTYTVVVTDAAGCSGTATVAVSVTVCTVPCNLTVTALASLTAVCVGGSVNLSSTVTPTGSYTYAWSGSNGF
ncbi:MAG: hypothetical protein JWP57_4001, partial [Spirosoma sp.]|nr:hypothetical protein [Spirosoma sp.]